MCRYDLHEWLFTLHNALESFKKKMERLKQRQEQREAQAALAGEQGATRDAAGGQEPPAENTGGHRTNTAVHNKTSATAGHTPPYRRAPPPPRDKLKKNRVGGVAIVAGVNGGVFQENGSPRRKPARPAPQAPGGKKGSNRLSGQGNPQGSPVMLPQYSPPHPLGGERTRSYSQDGYSTLESYPEGYGTLESNPGAYGTLESNPEGYGTLNSGQHVIVDLQISQGDREPLSLDMGGAMSTSPAHMRSSSDPLVIMHQMSNSLPELLDETGNSTSPEGTDDPPTDHTQAVENMHSPGTRHTRHLSLMGGKKESVVHHSRRKPKRGGSLKQRSRSPPNLPPPPPPPADHTLLSDSVLSSPEGTGSPLNVSNVSGFSGVMRTMTSIDQQLNAITENFTTSAIITPSLPPGRPPPPPPTQVEFSTVTFTQTNLGPSPIPISPTSQQQQCKVPSPVPEMEEDENFCEEEWLCDAPVENGRGHHMNGHAKTQGNRMTGFGGHSNVVGDIKPKKTHRVMFKEEVEAIPNYEPRIDQEDDSSGEETAIDDVPPTGANRDALPSGVAAIKMKLFGKQEAVATRYKKDGVLSPKYTHPQNTTFSTQYFNTDVMDIQADHAYESMNGSHENGVSIIGHHEDNANNNNSERSPEDSRAVENIDTQDKASSSDTSKSIGKPDIQDVADVPEAGGKEDHELLSPSLSSNGDKSESHTHNLYESPWDEKPISKYKVIGIVRKSASPSGRGNKEKSPPPSTHKQGGASQRIQFAEVSTKETPVPSATELRNVHSLERSLARKSHHQTLPQEGMATSTSEDSLLASISSTLKATSLFGSDNLLCNEKEKKMAAGSFTTTTKGELEKIRAAHRSDDTAIVCTASMGSLPGNPRHSCEFSSAHSTPFRSHGGGKQAALADTRMTKSLDGLQSKRSSEMSHNPRIQAHILRSLV